ncbi:MAG: HDOD domain-containing protein [Planctomycetes bacterium]|nr:HDOD domain-containing protein [Planctomycetota bacterium]
MLTMDQDQEQLQSLDHFLNRLDKLHSSPTVALRVMEITRDPDFQMNSVAECLELDPALSASILRLVNSSYYGLIDEVTNLRHALTYLGRRSLRLAVLSFGLVKTLVSGAPAQFHQQYWKRSLTMGAAARECAKLIDDQAVDPDTAFATGLIADLGMLAIAQLETEKYIPIAEEPDHTIDLVQRERTEFGFDHMAVSQRLMSRWQLPEDLVEAVGNHHTYLPASAPLNQIALVANLITEVIWMPVCPYMQPLQQVMIRQLDLGIDDLITLVLATKESIEEGSEIFGVQLQGEIDLESVEIQARELYKVAALDMAADLDSIEAFAEIPLQ